MRSAGVAADIRARIPSDLVRLSCAALRCACPGWLIIPSELAMASATTILAFSGDVETVQVLTTLTTLLITVETSFSFRERTMQQYTAYRRLQSLREKFDARYTEAERVLLDEYEENLLTGNTLFDALFLVCTPSPP